MTVYHTSNIDFYLAVWYNAYGRATGKWRRIRLPSSHPWTAALLVRYLVNRAFIFSLASSMVLQPLRISNTILRKVSSSNVFISSDILFPFRRLPPKFVRSFPHINMYWPEIRIWISLSLSYITERKKSIGFRIFFWENAKNTKIWRCASTAKSFHIRRNLSTLRKHIGSLCGFPI